MLAAPRSIRRERRCLRETIEFFFFFPFPSFSCLSSTRARSLSRRLVTRNALVARESCIREWVKVFSSERIERAWFEKRSRGGPRESEKRERGGSECDPNAARLVLLARSQRILSTCHLRTGLLRENERVGRVAKSEKGKGGEARTREISSRIERFSNLRRIFYIGTVEGRIREKEKGKKE